MEWIPTLYLLAFAGSGALSWLLTPFALRLAVRRGILDRPGSYKQQESPTPYLGGAAIVGAFATAVGIASLFGPPGARAETLLIVGLGLALSLMGLVDDIKGLPPGPRFALEALAAAALYWGGVQIHLFGAWPDAILTLVWIVGITNAFNLLDNMDGLSAGVAAIASLFFLLIAAMEGQFLVASLAAALAGCALGFLRHNFHPAKIYMGDAGSLFLGFMLAVIGIKLRFDGPNEATFFVPIAVLGVPIFDTILVVSTRLLHRRNPLSGGRDHASHRLVFLGLPVRIAVALVYLGAVSVGWLGFVISTLDVSSAILLMIFVISVGMFFGVLLGTTPVYENSNRRRMMLVEVAPHEDPDPPAEHSPTTAEKIPTMGA